MTTKTTTICGLNSWLQSLIYFLQTISQALATAREHLARSLLKWWYIGPAEKKKIGSFFVSWMPKLMRFREAWFSCLCYGCEIQHFENVAATAFTLFFLRKFEVNAYERARQRVIALHWFLRGKYQEFKIVSSQSNMSIATVRRHWRTYTWHQKCKNWANVWFVWLSSSISSQAFHLSRVRSL